MNNIIFSDQRMSQENGFFLSLLSVGEINSIKITSIQPPPPPGVSFASVLADQTVSLPASLRVLVTVLQTVFFRWESWAAGRPGPLPLSAGGPLHAGRVQAAQHADADGWAVGVQPDPGQAAVPLLEEGGRDKSMLCQCDERGMLCGQKCTDVHFCGVIFNGVVGHMNHQIRNFPK